MNRIIKWAMLPLIIVSLPSLSSADESKYPVARSELTLWQLPEVTYPANNPYLKSVEELGRQLFFDPRLTGDRSTSCAACHFPGTGWSDPLPNKAENARAMERQTPSLVNIAFQQSFFWDGRGKTLEEAVELHLKELTVISGELPDLPRSYVQIFQHAFGDHEITPENISKAIANFLRTIVVNDTPFDRWIAGDASAISQSARKGFILFTTKAGCVKCHSAPNFTDSKFHNIGLNSLDPGRFDVNDDPAQRNSFRTPPLRQISKTSPYMHNGSKKNLMAVIEFYSHGGDRHGKNNELKQLKLSEDEEGELLDFLMSLSGSNSSVFVPELPVGDNP